MKNLKYILPLVLVLSVACNTDQKETDTNQKNELAFAKGEKVVSENFTGTVWLNYLVPTDSVHHVNIGSVTFEPGARTNWHYHEGGQILLVTEGKGLYQEKGKSVESIEKGDVIKCPPGIQHWHGATPSESMTHIAIGTNTQIGGAIWLEPVTDEEYNK
jgi:quercetin dioxygenase-like cupin family protein